MALYWILFYESIKVVQMFSNPLLFRGRTSDNEKLNLRLAKVKTAKYIFSIHNLILRSIIDILLCKMTKYF